MVWHALAGSSEDAEWAAVTVADVWGEGLVGQVVDGNWITGLVPSLLARFAICGAHVAISWRRGV